MMKLKLRLAVSCVCVCLVATSCGRDRSGDGTDGGPDVIDAGVDLSSNLDASADQDMAGASDMSTSPDGGADSGTPDPVGYVPTFEGLDKSFGRGGLQTVGNSELFGGPEALWDVEILTDGRILAFGRNFHSVNMVRATASGALDRTFGEGGVRLMPLGDALREFQFWYGSVVMSPDGGVTFATHVAAYGQQYFTQMLGKVAADGAFDSSFGDDGVVVFEPPFPGNFTAPRVATQSDGKLVVAFNPAQVGRFHPDGSLDTTFGTEGYADITFGGNAASVTSLSVLSDDRILVGGVACCSAVSLGLAMLTAGGNNDTSFGGTGWTTDSAEDGLLAMVYDAAETADGKLIVAAARATTDGRDSQFAVGRFLADGMLDTSFGDAGWVLESGDSGRAFGVEIQPDGKIVAVGAGEWSVGPGNVVRLNEDGSLDTGFDADGVAQAPTFPLGLALQPDGAIVVAGRTGFTRLLSDGSLDPGFGVGGSLLVTTNRRPDLATDVASDGEGNLVIAGRTGDNPSGPLLTRLRSNGEVDTSFGTGGLVTSLSLIKRVQSIAIDGEGRILCGGFDDGAETGSTGFHLGRMSSAGEEDTAFTSKLLTAGILAGAEASRTTDMAYVDDTTIYVGGTLRSAGADLFGILKVDVDGNVDGSFGDEGVATTIATTSAPEIEVGPDGSPFAVFADRLVKFTHAGALDTSYGVDGSVVTDVQDTAFDSDGSIYVLGRGLTDGVWQTRVTRFNADGSIDASFGTDGQVLDDIGTGGVGAVHMQGERIVVAATQGTRLRTDGVLFAYDRTGARDTTFGAGGRIDAVMSAERSALREMTLDPQGRLIAIGEAWTQSGGDDFAVIRLE